MRMGLCLLVLGLVAWPVMADPGIATSLDQFKAGIATRQAAIAAHTDWTCSKDGAARLLSLMVDVDQFWRESAFTVCQPKDTACDDAASKLELAVDAQDLRLLKALLKRTGWEQLSGCGPRAGFDAWLIAQHADVHPGFQAQVLKSLEQAWRHGKARPQDYAYLYDRVATNYHRPQVFGSQGGCTGKGRWAPHPDLRPAQLDSRRHEMRLPSEADYITLMNTMCGG